MGRDLLVPLRTGGTTRDSNKVVMLRKERERWEEDVDDQIFSLLKRRANLHEVQIRYPHHKLWLPIAAGELYLPMINDYGFLKEMLLPLDRYSGEQLKKEGFGSLRKLIATHNKSIVSPSIIVGVQTNLGIFGAAVGKPNRRGEQTRGLIASIKQIAPTIARHQEVDDLADIAALTPFKRKPPIPGPMASPVKIIQREKPPVPRPVQPPPTRAILMQQMGEMAVSLTEWNRLQGVADGARPKLDQHKARLLAQYPEVEPNPKAKGIAREFSQMHRLFRKIGKSIAGAEDALNRWAKRQRMADKERRVLDRHVARMQTLLTQTESPDPKIVRQLNRMQQAIVKFERASHDLLAESAENAWTHLANRGPEITDDAGDVSTLPPERRRQTPHSSQSSARAMMLIVRKADRLFRHGKPIAAVVHP